MDASDIDQRTTALAWTAGSMIPASEGKKGYSAAAWAISYDGGRTREMYPVSLSCQPDEDDKLANIRAIIGVLQTVGPGTRSLTIYTNQEWIVTSYRNGWKKTNGVAAAHAAEAYVITTFENDTGISLAIEHRKLDKIGKPLKEQATAAARAKNQTLTGAERRAGDSFPGTSDFNRAGGFPEIEPDPEDDY